VGSHPFSIALVVEGDIGRLVVGVEILEDSHINLTKVVGLDLGMGDDLVSGCIEKGCSLSVLIGGESPAIPSVKTERHLVSVVVFDVWPSILLKFVIHALTNVLSVSTQCK